MDSAQDTVAPVAALHDTSSPLFGLLQTCLEVALSTDYREDIVYSIMEMDPALIQLLMPTMKRVREAEAEQGGCDEAPATPGAAAAAAASAAASAAAEAAAASSSAAEIAALREQLREAEYSADAARSRADEQVHQRDEEIARLRRKLEEAQRGAHEATLYYNELEVLRAREEDRLKLESEVSRLRKRLDEARELKQLSKDLEESNREHIARCAELEEENRIIPVLRAQLEASKQEVDALQQQVCELQAISSGKDAAHAQLLHEAEELKRREFEARSEVHTLQRKLRALEEEKHEWELAGDSMLQEAFTPELKEKMHRLETENEILRRAHSDDALAQLANLQSALDDALRQRSKYEQDFVSTRHALCETELLADSQRKRITQLESEQLNQISENKLLLERMAVSERRTEELQRALAAAEATIADLQQQAALHEQARRQLHDEFLSLKKEHGFMDQEKGELAASCVRLTERLDSTSAQLEATRAELQQCSQSLCALQKEHSQLRADYTQLCSERDQLTRELRASRDEALRVHGAKDALHQRLEDSVAAERRLEREISQLRLQLNDLRRENMESTAEYERLLASARLEADRVQAEVEAQLRSRTEKLQSQVDAERQRAVSYESLTATLKRQIEALRLELEEYKAERELAVHRNLDKENMAGKPYALARTVPHPDPASAAVSASSKPPGVLSVRPTGPARPTVLRGRTGMPQQGQVAECAKGGVQ